MKIKKLTPKQAAEYFSVNVQTLRVWDKEGKIKTERTPGGDRRYLIEIQDEYHVCYCRVSSHKQKDDLERQINFMQEKYPNADIIKKTISGSENQAGGIVAVDPGVRTFAAFYSPNISGKIGEGDFARIYRLLLHLDRLYSRRAKANRRNKKSLTKAIRRMTAKIRNLTTELHWKTARFLCENFAVILMPTYETKQMVKKAGRKIRSETVRSMLGFANYKFRQRLKWMAEKLGVTVLDVCEAYTSKTHPQIGEVKNKGSAKQIRLTDGKVAERDLVGEYNILIKFLTECCTLGDTPVVCS
ncbi:MAG: MerR family DNA-binding transcriptional regulator [Desulfobacterales bacterium]|nr:MerR family DNA-binding transcriptional regulator [Desulfobacterales bacterium]